MVLALALPTLTTVVGCGDESRQGGTQVRESEKDKAVVDSMRDDMLKQNKERGQPK